MKGLGSRTVWIRIVLCLAVVALMIAAATSDRVMAGIQGVLARVTGGVLALLGQRPVVEGNTVFTARFGITVVTACTGLFLTGLFLVAVLAFPATVPAKLIGAGLGVGGIFLLNVVRLVSLYFVGVHFPGILDTVHLLVWQSLLIVFAVVLWMVWAGTWGRSKRETEAAT